MEPELQVLAQALSVIGLALGTLGYGFIVRRRRSRRRQVSAAADTGLQGLVRVMVEGYVPE